MVFGGLLWIVVAVGLYEYLKMSIPGISKKSLLYSLMLGFIMSLTIYLILVNYLPWNFLVVIFVAWVLQLLEIFFINREKAKHTLIYKILGYCYIVWPVSFFLVLYYPGLNFNKPEYYLLLSFFIIIWVNDTFAYFTGKILGKTPLAPKISPRKTIEGSVGGLIFSVLAGWILHYVFNGLSLSEWMGLASIIVVFGSLGDLLESSLKRRFSVKDSGNFIPGHGGILDRFDSAIVAAPMVILYLFLIH